jgi:hypothetical protein
MSKSRLGASRVVAMLCAFAVGSVSIPTRAWADTTPQPSPPTSIHAAVKRAAADHYRLEQKKQDRSSQTAASQSQTPAEGAQALQSGSFFKSSVGIAVLAAFGAGVGYALYSASNDRIRSSGR